MAEPGDFAEVVGPGHELAHELSVAQAGGPPAERFRYVVRRHEPAAV
jgi:hypothetical protein